MYSNYVKFRIGVEGKLAHSQTSPNLEDKCWILWQNKIRNEQIRDVWVYEPGSETRLYI